MQRSTSTMPSMEQTRELVTRVWAHCQGRLPAAGSRRVGLFWAVRLTLLWLRTNLTQEMLTLMLPRDVSQPTISRIITTYTRVSDGLCKSCLKGSRFMTVFDGDDRGRVSGAQLVDQLRAERGAGCRVRAD